MKAKAKVYMFLLVTVITGQVSAQKARNKADYIKTIQQFYNCLLSDKTVTIKETKIFFDWEIVAENEAYLFEKGCEQRHIKDKDCDKQFEKHFYDTPNPISVYFLKIKEQVWSFTQGTDKTDVTRRLQDSSILIDVVDPSYVLIKIPFPDRRFVHFMMNKYPDEPATISDIYLPNGTSFSNKIYPQEKRYLKLSGKINDPDGYINVRKSPDAKSPIVGKIKAGKKFVYMPTSESFCWKVQKEDTPSVTGYVYYDRVIPYRK